MSFKNLRKFARDVVNDRLKEIEENGFIKNDILSVVISKSSIHTNNNLLINLRLVNFF